MDPRLNTRREGKSTMSRLLHSLVAPFDPIVHDAREPGSPASIDDDFALGFESAFPDLQFDSWDPTAAPAQAPTTSY
jgi:hypothetical protein